MSRRTCVVVKQIQSNPINWGRDKMVAIFGRNILKCILLNEIFKFWIKFQWSLFLMVQLTFSQHWFRYWLGTKQVISHYMNQWWSTLLLHMCVTQLQWVILKKKNIVCQHFKLQQQHELTHWGRVTHICLGNLAIIGSDNGLSPSRRQAIIWTNAGIL